MRKILIYITNLSITWKFILSYFAILIIPILLTGIYLYNQAGNSIVTQAQQVLEQSLNQTNENIRRNITIVDNISQIVSTDNKIITFLDNRFYSDASEIEDYRSNIVPFMENILRQNKLLYSMRIYMVSKTIPEIWDSFYSIDRINKDEWYEKMEKSADIVSYWRTTHKALEFREIRKDSAPSVLSYCHWIYTKNQSRVGLLVVEVKEKDLFGSADSENLSKFGRVLIIENANKTIVSSPTSSEYGKTFKLDEQQGIKTDTRFNQIKKVEGISSIIISLPIEGIGCSILGYFPLSHFTSQLRRTGTVTISVIVISSIFLGVILYFVTVLLLRRIKKMVAAMKMVREGNLDITIKVRSKDEFGELAQTFNHMTARVHDLVETVYKIQLMEKNAELKALEAQINPHFLYNTLATISWAGRKVHSQEIVTISNSLAKFYRLVLNKGNTLISIGEELEMLKAYLEIQKLRFDDLFDIVYKVDEKVYKYKMMKSILQPIVENSLNHGIEPKLCHGTLIIKVEEVENYIVFEIIDDGVGMSSAILRAIMDGSVERTTGSGYAIKNINERLKAFYKDGFSLEIFTKPGIGTSVKITLSRLEE